jgi:mRNA interferase MazF
MAVKRGEIYWVEFDPVRGGEPGRLRPALVVQNDTGNRHSPTTVVVAVTRTVPPRRYPFVVIVEPQESGLPEWSAINCSQIATIQQAGPDSRLRPARGESEVHPIGELGPDKMNEVAEALRFNLALE